MEGKSAFQEMWQNDEENFKALVKDTEVEVNKLILKSSTS